MLDEADDEVRELLGNGGEILPSDGSADPSGEPQLLFRKDATEQEERRYEQLEPVRAARYRGGWYGR